MAENTTDGVISPLFYAAIGGPVLLWGFKAANTLDSMVGYLDEKYRDVGWSNAKLDDVFNYIPARITAGLMCLAADAMHILPGGTHDYFGKPIERPAIGDADRAVERADIGKANRLLYVTSALMLGLILLTAILL